MLHYIHHKYNKEHTLSPFAGLAFHPLDGILQVCIHSFVHSLICACIHLCMHSFVHSFVRSFIHLFIHMFVCSFVHPSMHLPIHPSNCLCGPSIHLPVRSFVRSLTHSSVRLFFHSFTHSFFHSFIHSCICSVCSRVFVCYTDVLLCCSVACEHSCSNTGVICEACESHFLFFSLVTRKKLQQL